MPKPQQPDVARSGRGATDPASAKAKVSERPETSVPAGPVPEENEPGHHPAHDQDQPDRPPPHASPPPDEDGDEEG